MATRKILIALYYENKSLDEILAESGRNDRLAMLGAIEGKAVEYRHLSPKTLLGDEDI